MALPSVDTITYFIEVEDINGCTDTASVQVFVSEQDTNVINAEIYACRTSLRRTEMGTMMS